jgi:hypothetical protein
MTFWSPGDHPTGWATGSGFSMSPCDIPDHGTSMDGRIAQSVERWSNKPLVMGSSPIVTTVFFLLSRVIHMNAFVAERLRRYVQVVVNFVGVGSSPTECSFFFVAIGEEQKAKIGGTTHSEVV